MAHKDYYAVLGLTKNATEAEIKSAYKKLAKKLHPDVNKETDAQEKFKEVSQAYQVLSDKDKRQAYDQMGHANFEQARQQGFRGSNTGGGFGSYNINMDDLFGGGFRDPFDIFSELFGQSSQGRQRRNTQRRGEDIEIVVKITFEEAAFGTDKEFSYGVYQACKSCEGSGSSKGSTGSKTCTTCAGQGQVYTQSNFLGARFSQLTQCPQCNGKGTIISNPCSDCKGSGRAKKDTSINIKIPPGVDNGTQMRIPGKGNRGENDAPAGDLYVTFKVEPHKIFKRDGSNLHLEIPISIPQAVLGDTVEILTLEGRKKIKIPAGTNHRDKIKLSNQGIQHLNGSVRGDLIITIRLEIPTKLTATERELFQKLGNIETQPKSFFDKLFS